MFVSLIDLAQGGQDIAHGGKPGDRFDGNQDEVVFIDAKGIL